MRKLLLVALAVSMLSACGKSETGKGIAEDVCECIKKTDRLSTDDPLSVQAKKDCITKGIEGWNKIKDNKKEADDYTAVMSKCAEGFE